MYCYLNCLEQQQAESIATKIYPYLKNNLDPLNQGINEDIDEIVYYSNLYYPGITMIEFIQLCIKHS